MTHSLGGLRAGQERDAPVRRWTDRVGCRTVDPTTASHLEEMTMPSHNPAFGRGFANATNGAAGQQYGELGRPPAVRRPDPGPVRRAVAVRAHHHPLHDDGRRRPEDGPVVPGHRPLGRPHLGAAAAGPRPRPGPARGARRVRAGPGDRLQADRQPGRHAGLRRPLRRRARRDQRGVQQPLPRHRHAGGDRHVRCLRRHARRLQDRRHPGHPQADPLDRRRDVRRPGPDPGQPRRQPLRRRRRARPA